MHLRMEFDSGVGPTCFEIILVLAKAIGNLALKYTFMPAHLSKYIIPYTIYNGLQHTYKLTSSLFAGQSYFYSIAVHFSKVDNFHVWHSLTDNWVGSLQGY